MSFKYDAIVIGAGHNGLTCACYLAKAGLKVLVLEEYHSIGGMANTEEITLPGFKSDTHAIGYQFANLSPAPHELDLARYGFELLYPDPSFSHVFPDGSLIACRRDVELTCASIGQYSVKDAATWRMLFQQFHEKRDSIARAVNSPPLSLSQQSSTFEELPGGLDEYRFQMQTLRSWCDEVFEAEQTKALFAAWASHTGNGPDDAGGASLAWLFAMLIQHDGNNAVKGGMRHLPLALAGFLEAHGGEIRTNARVEKIIVEDGKAVAVRLRDGEKIDIGTLAAASVDPQQLVLDLLGKEQVGANVVEKIRRYELGPAVMVIYLALDGSIEYKAGPPASEGIYTHPSPPSLDYFARLFQQVRGGMLPDEPFALVCHDSAADPSRVPAGKGLMKLVVQPVPYTIRGDASGKFGATAWENVKEQFADYVIERLRQNYIPDLSDKILNRVVHSPVDLEQIISTARRGTITHGAILPYQTASMRPIPEMGNYRSQVPNVYLCGSGSHPGPGISMAPGRNAAQVIYADLKLDFARVNAR